MKEMHAKAVKGLKEKPPKVMGLNAIAGGKPSEKKKAKKK